MDKQYYGTYAALVTPYTGKNEVNYNELQKLVSHLVERGIDSFAAGSIADAKKYQIQANYVIKAICKHGVFASVKTILEIDGFSFNGCRRPFSPITDEGKAELLQVYEKYILPSRN